MVVKNCIFLSDQQQKNDKMILKKLKYKNYNPVLATGIPVEFYDFQKLFTDMADVQCQPFPGVKYNFVISFVQTIKDVEWVGANVIPKLSDDAVFWVAYPKKTSKKFNCEISRDSGWDALKLQGYDGVSMIALDNDWSAFRFRHVSKIKSKKK